MATYEMRQSDGQTAHLQSEIVYLSERFLPGSHAGARGSMPTPSIPVDPALESWSNSNIASFTGMGFDPTFPPTTAPGLFDKSNFMGVSAAGDAFQQDVQLPSMRQSDVDTTPLGRFYHDPGPWTSQRVVRDMDPPSTTQRYLGIHNRVNLPPVIKYRDSPRSDLESSTTGRNPQDSGYESNFATKSVRSTEQIDRSQECQSLVNDVDEMQIYPVDKFQAHDHGPDLPQESHYTFPMSNLSAPSLPAVCPYPECKNMTFKNLSDQKKHEVRHTKPYKCQESNCNRNKGFSTKNDLERHKKSVHKIAPKNLMDKSYRCKAKNCPKKDKIWPRPDNFRQHCKRMHCTEDTEELLRISEINSGFSLQSDNVDALPGDSDLSKSEQNAFEASVVTNLHTLQREPLHNFKGSYRGPNNPFHESMGQLDSPSIGSLIEDPIAKVTQCDSSYSSAVNSGGHGSPSARTPLGGADGLGRFSDLKGLASTCNLPERESLILEQSQEVARSMNIHSDPLANRKPNAVSIETEEARKFCLDVMKRLRKSKGSVEEMESILQSSVMALSNTNGTHGTRKRSCEDASLAETSDTKRMRVACDQCPKTMIRHCDLKKHKKRHTRPYGCTFTSCSKVFGSKNDWKRHENTQHYQVEAWRCGEANPTSKIKQCAKVFHRREQFQAHLKEHHSIADEENIRMQTKQNRIGRNGQCGFWCGFCREIISLKRRGLEAWDERFNHIDDRHFKRGEKIHDWYPLDKDIPKGFSRIHDGVVDEVPSSPSDESESTSGASSEDSETGELRQSSPQQTTKEKSPISEPVPPPTTPKRSGSNPSSKGHGSWYCCSCHYGPMSSLIDIACPSCDRSRCGTCL